MAAAGTLKGLFVRDEVTLWSVGEDSSNARSGLANVRDEVEVEDEARVARLAQLVEALRANRHHWLVCCPL